ncbi:threonine/serine exporter family protein [Pararhodospirillum photometricum]|uniref:Threonine/serine exporter-like N-terminal domain-containing protein n=1 Tax=Pararhodospirillum photometricum DSM 122 TaxID=1150469 RepID=H6SM87_PARPM|nr:threonine/serine exporter family protein [Pararhodospirillum photometricum]CCG06770.1 unnamed protein product [Pararhodospirillum photometricum DSM 122]
MTASLDPTAPSSLGPDPLAPDLGVMAHRRLEAIGLVALRLGQLLMESGARSGIVDTATTSLARALGAADAEARAGYASLTLTVRHGVNSITRMVGVGPHGVNHRLEHALRSLVRRVMDAPAPPETVQIEIERLARETPRHPRLLTASAVGLACAAFAHLLGADPLGVAAVAPVAALAQGLRVGLHHRKVNTFLIAFFIAFGSAAGAGALARLLESTSVGIAMVAATLLLVPGVPALNALGDILEGHPTLGTARLVAVLTHLIFLSIGLWTASLVVGLPLVPGA